MPKIENKVVVRFRDGRMLKGYTYDFKPPREIISLLKDPPGKLSKPSLIKSRPIPKASAVAEAARAL